MLIPGQTLQNKQTYKTHIDMYMYMTNSRSDTPTFSPRAIVVGAHLKEGECGARAVL